MTVAEIINLKYNLDQVYIHHSNVYVYINNERVDLQSIDSKITRDGDLKIFLNHRGILENRIKNLVEIIAKNYDLTTGAINCLVDFEYDLEYELSDECIYCNHEINVDKELLDFVQEYNDEIESELDKYINEHKEEILKKHNEREARMKEQVSSWTWEKSEQNFTKDFFDVKLTDGSDVLCIDYSDIPAEDIVSVTKYTGCYPINIDMHVEPSDERILDITYTGVDLDE